MNTLELIEHFVVPQAVVAHTDTALRDAGRRGSECFVLWSGVHRRSTFEISSVHVPQQIGYRFAEGLCVHVEGEELHRLNIWLYEHHEELAVQIHSHPTEAYHSDTDDAYPIVTVRGGLSLVVPDFARFGVRCPGLAGYRLTALGWTELSDDELRTVLVFEE